MKVLVAMSGGVDSSVAAARLVAEGHAVTGVHLALNRNPDTYRSGARGCCSLEDSLDARRVADLLGVPFYVWDLSERFHADVVTDFVAEYAAGRTPNPCLRCNEKIKFAAVLERGVALGFDAVATGHYARLEQADGEARLYRAADAAKDQSYVLGVLTQAQLRRSLVPLYGSVKADVRAEAAALGLRVAAKPDSHDICFIPSGDTRAFLGARIGVRPGAVVDDESGTVLARHAGVHGFTIGQRKGLGIGAPAGDGRPRYVTAIEPEAGTVRVGSAARLDVWEIGADRAIWTSGVAPDGPVECTVQVRAHGGLADAVVEVAEDGLVARLRSPLTGVARGQAVVAYRPDPEGDIVLGSGTIARTA